MTTKTQKRSAASRKAWRTRKKMKEARTIEVVSVESLFTREQLKKFHDD